MLENFTGITASARRASNPIPTVIIITFCLLFSPSFFHHNVHPPNSTSTSHPRYISHHHHHYTITIFLASTNHNDQPQNHCTGSPLQDHCNNDQSQDIFTDG